MNVSIRELCLADIVAVQQIDEHAHRDVWSKQTFVDQVRGTDRVHLVAAIDDHPVAHGALWLDGPTARVTNVAVAKKHRRTGLAALVVRHLCERARRSEQSMCLSLEVGSTNHAAQGLYRSFGFVPVGIERSFYGPGDDAIVMHVADLEDPSWITRIDAQALIDASAYEGAVR